MNEDVRTFLGWIGREGISDGSDLAYSDRGFRIIVTDWARSLLAGDGTDVELEASE